MSPLDVCKRSLGLSFNAAGEAEIRVWAPWARQVAVTLDRSPDNLPLQKDTTGYWQLTTDQIKPGDLYLFLLDNQKEYTDPASLALPQGIYGPSQAVDTKAFYWEDSCWVNPPVDEYRIYELDIDTFTPQGTLGSIINKLAELKKKGINAIAIKPVTPFPKLKSKYRTNGFLYAVQTSYGGAAQLQRLVDTCHYEGIAVIIDMEYDTVGQQSTNEDQYQALRWYLTENALMWFRDFHIDALRFDAEHTSPNTLALLTEIRECTNALTAKTDRHQHYLLVEQETVESQVKIYQNDCLYDSHFARLLHSSFNKESERVSSGLCA